MDNHTLIGRMLRIYNTSISDYFKNLTLPLKTFYNFDYVSYSRVTHDGEFFDISNDPSIAEKFYCQKLYEISPFKQHPDYYINGAYLPSALKDEKYRDLTAEIGKKFSCGFYIIKKDEDGAHFFTLGSSNKKVGIGVALNNLSIFGKFCDYLIQNMKSQMNKMEPFLVSVPSLIGEKKFLKKPKLYLGTDLECKKGFLESIGIHSNGAFEFLNLSRREHECLRLFVDGKSTKEIASILHISTRTVEFHIHSINKKMHCSNRYDILKKIDYLELLGLYS